MDALETVGLTKHYGRRPPPIHPPFLHPTGVVRALEDLSISVRVGEIFGFLGPNGAGKSTMIRLLLGFLHPTSGRASVLGHDVVSDSVEVRRRVGYLPGGVALYDGLSGEQQLDYLAAQSGRKPVLRAELVDRLELSPRTLRRGVRDYSRGMRQKIGIVQALQHDPELAVLDEPTEGLDPLMQRAFYDILDRLKASGRTIFFSSHVLSEVERVCDRVAIIRRGRLVALQDVAGLLARRKRNVEMRVVGPPPRLEGVQGISGVVVSDGRLTAHLEGDVGPFLQALGTARITDLTIEPAHLEEAFLEYYAEDESSAEERERTEPTPKATAPRGQPLRDFLAQREPPRPPEAPRPRQPAPGVTKPAQPTPTPRSSPAPAPGTEAPRAQPGKPQWPQEEAPRPQRPRPQFPQEEAPRAQPRDASKPGAKPVDPPWPRRDR